MIGVGIGLGIGEFRGRAPGIAPKLDLNFASTKSLTASKGPTPSFSRASTGTYFNSSGVLTTAAINAARFNHTYNGTSWVSRGLLVEAQRTNICLQSNFQSGWSGQGTSQSINQAQAPDGTITGTKVTVNTSGNYRSVYRTLSGSANCISVFAKANGINWIAIIDQTGGISVAWFNISNGTIGQVLAGYTAAIQDVGNGWYRCSVSHATSWTTSSVAQFNLTDGNSTNYGTASGSNSVFLWGSQAENGQFATSLIPTTSSSVTRSADVCQITGSDFSSFWNASEGSIAIEFDRPFIGGDQMVFRAQNAAGTKATYYFSSSSNEYYQIYGGSTPLTISGIPAAGSTVKTAIAFKSNDTALSRNGAAVVSPSSMGAIPTDYDQIRIGAESGAASYLNGHIARLRYFNKRLPNATLQKLST